MKRVSVKDLKSRLSEFLRLVKQGETIEVVERSMPIARLTAVTAEARSGDALLERLVFEGIVTRADRKPDAQLFEDPPVPCRLDPVDVLIEERGDR